ncbi:unnamed protein product, partial [Phaeothamnion confervicola]
WAGAGVGAVHQGDERTWKVLGKGLWSGLCCRHKAFLLLLAFYCLTADESDALYVSRYGWWNFLFASLHSFAVEIAQLVTAADPAAARTAPSWHHSDAARHFQSLTSLRPPGARPPISQTLPPQKCAARLRPGAASGH